MTRGPDLDAETDEFNSWARWVSDRDHDDGWTELCAPSEDALQNAMLIAWHSS